VASDGEVTVALDITLNEALIAEGTARDLVNKIQNIRKEKDFDITDRIHVTIEKHAAILEAVANFSDYIKGEVLADSLVLADALTVDKTELNDEVSLGIDVVLNSLANNQTKDNLTIIEGIGPKLEELLNQSDIWTFNDLGNTSVSRLLEILEAGGARFMMHNPETWPNQASLASKGNFDELKTWQESLVGGKI
jgi:Domain of unknown function (DUF5915)